MPIFTQAVRAPEFPADLTWLNSKRKLSMKKLKGYVVLLDFWTYCCINCIHVLPDLKSIEEKFKGKPVVVIGAHSPKFENEIVLDHLQSAIERYEITHPVIADNNHDIWNAYAVNAWPTMILIDPEGYVREQVSGEGQRGHLENEIEILLKEGEVEGTLADKPLRLELKKKKSKQTLSFPGKIEFDQKGDTLFISDSNHNRILICDYKSPAQVKIKNIIKGNFNHPQGIYPLGNNLYVCDTDNHLLKKVDLKTKKVSTIAGTGIQAPFGQPISGKALEIALSSPWDIDYFDKFFYIAMAGSHQIWRYGFENNVMELFAGNGYEGLVDNHWSDAELAQPSGLSIYGNDIYFTDSESSSLRKINIDEEKVATLIGKGLFTFGHKDGPFNKALLQHPLGVFANSKFLYIADTYNNAIRVVNLKTKDIETLVGREKGTDICMIGDKKCEQLALYEPNDIVAKNDLLFIADTNNHLIRVFDPRTEILDDLKIK
ncbi:MAG: redoxin domain-containing protein [Candidatus Roizmanbacteria bacterium]|nr:MAG: redoxin domain-containing protein [Candidatus Roizmanbacteria bacterium]